MADYENMENDVTVEEENVSETEGLSTKEGLLLAGAGLALVGAGFGLKAGIDKLKAHRAAKKASKENAPKEKKLPFWKRKKKSEEPAKVEEPAAPPIEENAETEKEES